MECRSFLWWDFFEQMVIRICPRSGRRNSDRQPVSSSGPNEGSRRPRLHALRISTVQVDVVHEAARRSLGPDLNSVSPVDAPWYSNVRTIVPARRFVALPKLPLGLTTTNAVQGSILPGARLPTMGLRQPVTKRYPPLRSAESTDAQPLPVKSLTAALGPFFFATSFSNLAISFRN